MLTILQQPKLPFSPTHICILIHIFIKIFIYDLNDSSYSWLLYICVHYDQATKLIFIPTQILVLSANLIRMAVHLLVINVIQQLAAHIVKDNWGSFANKNAKIGSD